MNTIKQVNEGLLKTVFETNTDFTEWFGYYNHDVISNDGSKMLCNRVYFDGRAINENDYLDLGWYDLQSGLWTKIGRTDSFNWPQGAMCQWLPGKGNSNKVIYNTTNDGHFVSAIYDIADGSCKQVCYPIYCITPDGKKSISLNYERSYWCRAYHYQSIKNPKYDVKIADDDGVFEVDLEENTVKRIISIIDVVKMDYQPDFDKAKHWLEHIMINNSGTQFTFLHRYSFENGYGTRVCIANIDGSGLQVVNGWKLNEWSHFGWKGDDAFVIYAIRKTAMEAAYAKKVQKSKDSALAPMTIIKRAIRYIVPKSIKNKFKGGVQTYQLFEKLNNDYVYIKDYDSGLFNLNGHPSFTKDGRYMITDTYPDQDGYQHILFYDSETYKGIDAGKLLAGLRGNPASCDLHPKLCYNDKYLVIDTAYTGKHRMIVFEICWDNIIKNLH